MLTAVDALKEFDRARYVSLTTFRKDGRGVATPVWLAVDGAEIFIVSDLDTGKVKRLLRDGHVTLAVCDFRGGIAPNALHATGTARVLDEAQTQRARALIARKYFTSRLGNWLVRIFHLPKRPVIGIVVTLDQ